MAFLLSPRDETRPLFLLATYSDVWMTRFSKRDHGFGVQLDGPRNVPTARATKPRRQSRIEIQLTKEGRLEARSTLRSPLSISDLDTGPIRPSHFWLNRVFTFALEAVTPEMLQARPKPNAPNWAGITRSKQAGGRTYDLDNCDAKGGRRGEQRWCAARHCRRGQANPIYLLLGTDPPSILSDILLTAMPCWSTTPPTPA